MKQLKVRLIALSLFLLLVTLFTSTLLPVSGFLTSQHNQSNIVIAATPPPEPTVTGPGIKTSKTDKSIEQIAMDIITNVILPVIGGVAMLYIIYGGVLIMTSSGDPEKLTKAKKTLLWAIIGIIIVALSYGVVVSLSGIILDRLKPI